MKLGTLLEMNAIRTTPAKVEVYVHNPDRKSCRSLEVNTLSDFLRHKDKEIEDWNYYTEPDKIVVHVRSK